MQQLKWKDEIISGYLVSDDGHVFTSRGEMIPISRTNYWNFYPTVDILHDDYTFRMHRVDYLVAYTFKGYPNDIIRLVHLDDNIDNCRLDNLMWLRQADVIDKYKELYAVDDITEIQEEWKPYNLQIYQKDIEVSNYGRVRHKDSLEILISKDDHGYPYFNGERRTDGNRRLFVHRMVAELFVNNPKPNEYKYVNHIDGNKQNPVFWNLEWCNISMNTEAGYHQKDKFVYDDELVHKICQLLQDGADRTQISLITGANKKYISKIATGYRRSDISKHYTLPVKISLDEKFGKDKVAKLLLTGLNVKETANMLNIEYTMQFISYCDTLKRKLGLL